MNSSWQRVHGLEPSLSRNQRVLPLDARSAALSYDGREPDGVLSCLTTLPIDSQTRPNIFSPPGVATGTTYIEMVRPNDAARQIHLEPSDPDLPVLERIACTYGLFGHDMEKGVVFRARLRACWLDAGNDGTRIESLYTSFLDEPLALGP